MMRVPRKPAKRQMESTISLINVVFLMLIFFLVAGQLSPPADPEVTLSETRDAPPLAPPEALYARADGVLMHREKAVTAETYLTALAGQEDREDGREKPLVKLAADEALPAVKLLDHVDALYAAGAGKVVLVTQRGTQ
ncbi:hypothetical protein GCM10011316_35320 [Roseibium aquae]|uniref:Biopolymer transport protein ExbD n=1 Tax=Roseibium aquae TaxID=1323746 RepID=A0A916TNE0_9HYPH|nr:biopolymer transporter ExbD [Roseibium aquae]GGB60223.1 hypothetical protein GCM10011316_35320 [Roseibium aquae]